MREFRLGIETNSGTAACIIAPKCDLHKAWMCSVDTSSESRRNSRLTLPENPLNLCNIRIRLYREPLPKYISALRLGEMYTNQQHADARRVKTPPHPPTSAPQRNILKELSESSLFLTHVHTSDPFFFPPTNPSSSAPSESPPSPLFT